MQARSVEICKYKIIIYGDNDKYSDLLKNNFMKFIRKYFYIILYLKYADSARVGSARLFLQTEIFLIMPYN